jgi:hypothetical protein
LGGSSYRSLSSTSSSSSSGSLRSKLLELHAYLRAHFATAAAS